MTRMIARIGCSAVAMAFSSSVAAQGQVGSRTPAPEQETLPSGAVEPDPPATDTPPTAQEGFGGDAVALDGIVVTAQKRSESLQRVPLAITAVTSADLARSNVTDLQGVVALVPNLNLGQQLGVAKVALRGIGLENIAAGAEGSIAFHLDGVFVSRSIAALASFYDVQQVEVLRGPQGTLYGRNATGGSININTRGPTRDFSGYGRITVGNYDRIVAEGAVGGPIVPDVLAVRVAFQTQDRDGYGENVITDNQIDDLKTRAVRGSVLFTPANRLTLDLKADYFRERDRSGGYHFLGAGGFSAPGIPIVPTGLLVGGTVAPNVRDISNDFDPRNNVEFWGVSGKLTYQLSDGTEFRSLTAYRRTAYTTRTDLDSTSAFLAPTTQTERASQFSQEFQLSGKSDRLNWLTGLFYFHENDRGLQSIPFNNLALGFPPPGTFVQGFRGGGSIKTDALAAFGQISYEVIDDIRFTVGARFSSEKKGNRDEFAFDFLTPFDPDVQPEIITLDRSKRFNAFTPRLAIDYQATPDTLLYASWSRGFKAGTFNLGALQPPVDPEKVSAFEAGLKSSLFDRRLRLNLAGFLYDYTDLQVGKVVGQTLRLENAATATIYGLEAEIQARVTPRFEINANAAWLHARFDEYISADPSRPFGDGTLDPVTGDPAFNLAGNSLSQSPDFTFFVGSQYRLPTDIGAFTLRGELSWRDRVYYTPFNVKYVSQEANTKVNAFLNWVSASESLTASLYVKNVTNKTTVGNSYISSALVGFPINGYLEEPRTYGVILGFNF